MPGIQNEATATILAGVIGSAIVVAIALILEKRKTQAVEKS